MKQIPLGRTDIMVSEWCLGTMTFGNQTAEADAHNQMDRALEAGINFFDTAEMYPVNPVAKETAGRSEAILGTWFAKTGRRSDVVCSGNLRMLSLAHPFDSIMQIGLTIVDVVFNFGRVDLREERLI